jgi:tryptophan synthase alpha chain
MNRIETAFSRARLENRAAFVAYVCGGDPNLDDSLKVCRTLIEKGTDILEIGVPFSDPLADGLTNQLAAERALRAGMTQERLFSLVRSIREFSEVPIVLYTYFNLILAHGMETFARLATEAGVDGVLTLDLPPEEATEFDAACAQSGLKSVYIVAPTSPEDRIGLIASHATGFIYYVSQEGVTGERTSVAADLDARVRTIRTHTDLPVVVGFGISKPEHVKTVAQVADGVVVGSALVNCIAANPDDSALFLTALQDKMEGFVPMLAKE